MENSKLSEAFTYFKNAFYGALDREAQKTPQEREADQSRAFFALNKGFAKGLFDGAANLVKGLGEASLYVGEQVLEEGARLFVNPQAYFGEKFDQVSSSAKSVYELGQSTYERVKEDPIQFIKDIDAGIQSLDKKLKAKTIDLAADTLKVGGDFLNLKDPAKQAESIGYVGGRVTFELIPLSKVSRLGKLFEGLKLSRFNKLRRLANGLESLHQKVKVRASKLFKLGSKVENLAGYTKDFSGQVLTKVKEGALKRLPKSLQGTGEKLEKVYEVLKTGVEAIQETKPQSTTPALEK
ncbi:MAG: hypothetical protein KDK66_05480 [Deltaproteobacteria bacterium]|nr:hypothetical protein [Deltaproteobacteria bacterium]